MGWSHTAVFYRQLAMMTRTGMPIVNALRLAGDVAGRDYRLKAELWAQGCSTGRDLAGQLAEAHEPPLVIALVRAGEATGRLPELGARIADHYDQLIALRGLAIGRLIYPAVLLHVALVVPAAPAIFLRDASPLWLLAGPAALWLVIGVLVALGRTSQRTGLLARLALFPGPRFVVMPFLTCNTCLVLSAAMAAGLKVRSGLELAADACGNRELAARLRRAAEDVGKGVLPDLTSALRACGFPRLLCDLVGNGEVAGALDVVLSQAAVAARESFQSRAAWATRIFTGSIYALILVYVAWQVVSMYSNVLSQAGGDPYGGEN